MRFGLDSFLQLTPDDRSVVCGWLNDHGVDPSHCDGLRLNGESLPVAECVEWAPLRHFDVVIDAIDLPPADVMFRWLELELEVAK